MIDIRNGKRVIFFILESNSWITAATSDYMIYYDL
jgi:hypothetical protein